MQQRVLRQGSGSCRERLGAILCHICSNKLTQMSSPKRGGPTTKVHAQEVAAEQQLEEELLDTAAAAAPTDATAGAEKAEPEGEKGEPKHASTSRRQYWLMKAEQEDRFETAHNGSQINTKFTIDDLKSNNESTGKPELWDGVRNHVAANNMRAMKIGDLAFFYASGGKAGRSPGIVGIMEIVSEAAPDPTVSDPGAYGYVEDGKQRDKWVVVGCEFRKKLSMPVSLKELQKHRDAGGKLEHMQLFKQSRLSVARVEKGEWDFIVNELVQGYE
jgi:predicted RNA-binding protein with PUA-like domain